MTSIKLVLDKEIRRSSLTISHDEPLTFEKLKALILKLFPILQDKEYQVCYVDDENDSVTFSSDEELNEAIKFMLPTSSTLKFNIEADLSVPVPQLKPEPVLKATSTVVKTSKSSNSTHGKRTHAAISSSSNSRNPQEAASSSSTAPETSAKGHPEHRLNITPADSLPNLQNNGSSTTHKLTIDRDQQTGVDELGDGPLTGFKRRRCYTVAEKYEIVQEYLNNRNNMTQFALEKNIKPKTFSAWMKEYQDGKLFSDPPVVLPPSSLTVLPINPITTTNNTTTNANNLMKHTSSLLMRSNSITSTTSESNNNNAGPFALSTMTSLASLHGRNHHHHHLSSSLVSSGLTPLENGLVTTLTTSNPLSSLNPSNIPSIDFNVTKLTTTTTTTAASSSSSNASNANKPVNVTLAAVEPSAPVTTAPPAATSSSTITTTTTTAMINPHLNHHFAKRFRVRKAEYPEIERKLIEFITNFDPNQTITWSLIRNNALLYAKEFLINDEEALNHFKASDGWIQNFLKRNNIILKKSYVVQIGGDTIGNNTATTTVYNNLTGNVNTNPSNNNNNNNNTTTTTSIRTSSELSSQPPAQQSSPPVTSVVAAPVEDNSAMMLLSTTANEAEPMTIE